MEYFRCPSCGELQETLNIEMEVVNGYDIMMPNEIAENIVENASIGIEASCQFCSYTSDPDDFKVIDIEEETEEVVEYIARLNFGSDFD